MKPLLKLVEHNSREYLATVDLRDRVLRKPLNLVFSQQDLARENSSFHIACYLENKLVGCLILRPADSGSIQMRQVAVDFASQGHGIGRELVLFAEEFARERGYKQMILNARQTAVPFYLRLSYQTRGDVFQEVGLPHMAMFKDLQSPD